MGCGETTGNNDPGTAIVFGVYGPNRVEKCPIVLLLVIQTCINEMTSIDMYIYMCVCKAVGL